MSADHTGAVFELLHGAEDALKTDAAHPFVASIPAEDADSARMVLDPLGLLREHLPEVVPKEDGWHVTLDRVDAQIPLHCPAKGPHHIIVSGIIFSDLKRVHCLVHRSVRGD
jgi:hypothetical protein